MNVHRHGTGMRILLVVIAGGGLAVAANSAAGQTIFVEPIDNPDDPQARPARVLPPWRRPTPMPRIRPRPPRIGRPLRDVQLHVHHHGVKVTIVDNVAVTEVDQVFYNPQPRTVEGTYIFPLGDDVALNQFSMFVNGKEIKGELLGVDEARRTYESIVSSMRDPALLEYIGSRMFRARIFPINPHSEVRIKLSYTGMLPSEDGLMRYRYPLDTEKYLSAPVKTVNVLVDFKSAVPIKSVFSASHKLAVVRKSDHEATASFEARDIYPDKDFELFVGLSRKEFGLTVLTHREKGEDGYFLARIAPPAQVVEDKVLPKDIAFVIDTSGSMAGDKMRQAKEALKYCLANLNAEDRFTVVPFSHEAISLKSSLLPATEENRSWGRDFVNDLRAEGGTNINDALLMALDVAPDDSQGRPYLIVFVTDGLPTIGEQRIETILANVLDKNVRRVRLFVFGVGHDVNTQLLDLLAEQNHGTRDYVEPDEDLELKLSSFYRKVANPVLAGLVLTLGDLRVRDMYPPKLGDLFSGTELVVVGRYDGAGAKAVELYGTRRGTHERFVYETTFPEINSENDFLPRLWATRKVGFLLDEIRLHGEKQELKDTVVALATRYGIVTPYTAYLVMEPYTIAGDTMRLDQGLVRAMEQRSRRSSQAPSTRMARRSSPGRRIRKAISPATGGRSLPGPGGNVQVSPDRTPIGADAVAGSLDAKAMRETEVFADGFQRGIRDEKSIKRVGSRTFYRVGERWVDSSYKEKAETRKIELFSEDYFKLVRAHPELAKCFALGERVVVVIDGTTYETVVPPLEPQP